MNFIIKRRPGQGCKGLLRTEYRVWPCNLGRSGQLAVKREGDGATPFGRFIPKRVYYRSDRVARPQTVLPIRPIHPDDGWCDRPGDRNYNRPVTLPYPASTERLWRDDSLYDIVVVLDYNELPRVQGRGSAIFMHIASADGAPTEGCIALTSGDLRAVLRLMRPNGVIISAL